MNEDFSDRKKLQDVGRWYITRFVESFAISLPTGSVILDAGAGESVYKKLFSHCEYKAIDLAVGESRWNYANLDYVAPLHKMPIEDNVFDAILCTQVLEHLEWPRQSVEEMYRVLKPGGKLVMTVPMSHPEHQIPYDFFRYTSYGLESICKNAGFRDTEISPFGGLWVRWAYELPRSLSIFPPNGIGKKTPNMLGVATLPLKVVAYLLVRLMQVVFLRIDGLDKKKDDPFGWACVATK